MTQFEEQPTALEASKTHGPAAEPQAFGPFDDEHRPPLDFDSWARIAAALLDRDADARLDLLEQRRLDPRLWDACEVYWAEHLAQAIGVGELGRAREYAAHCSAELSRRQASSGQASPKVAPAAVARGQSSSELSAHASLAKAAAGSEDVDQTAWLLRPVGLAALPFSEPETPRAPGPLVKPTDARPDLAGATEELRLDDMAQAPLPFLRKLSLEDYAALCAKLNLDPAQWVAIARDYGIGSRRELEMVHGAWILRFARDSKLRAEYERLEQHYRQHPPRTQ